MPQTEENISLRPFVLRFESYYSMVWLVLPWVARGVYGEPKRLHCYVYVGVAGVEGHVFGAVGAEGGFVVAAGDGEGVEDVGVCVAPPFPDNRMAPPQV